MARGKCYSHYYRLGTSWAGSNLTSPSLSLTLLSFADRAALVFNGHVGRDAIKDRMEFEAALFGKYMRSLFPLSSAAETDENPRFFL